MGEHDIGGVDSEELANEVIRDVVGNLETLEPGVEPLELGTEEEQPLEGEPVVEAPVTPIDPVAPVEPSELDETFLQLREIGIDFGIQKGELPPELHDAYDRLAGEAVTAVNAFQTRMNEMQLAQAEMQQFAQKLEQDPQKVLLTMAVTKPEEFQKAVQSYEEMQQDDRYKDMVIRELQAEAKLSAAERQQQVFQQRQMQTKIQVVTKATHVAADKLGVDRDLAEKYVAMQIQANGGDINPGTVEGIVSSLRVRTTPPINPAAKAARVAQAPTRPVEGQGTPTGNAGLPENEASPGLTKVSRNPFLSLVRDASRRVTHEP